MEKNRETKIIAVTSMIIAVITLTIGYAVFSKNLNIQNMSATVKANEANFKVKFSNLSTKLDESDIQPYFTEGAVGTGLSAHIDNSGVNPKLTNMGGAFDTMVDDYGNNSGYIYYSLYSINDGEYDAYLKSIKMSNVPGYDKPLVCMPNEGTSKELVDEACKNLHVKVSVTSAYIPNQQQKSYFIDATTEGVENTSPGKPSEVETTEMKLEKLGGGGKNLFHNVRIRIGAKEDTGFGAAAMAIDGSYEVKIGDVTLEYSSQD